MDRLCNPSARRMAAETHFSHKHRDAQHLGPSAKLLSRQTCLCRRKKVNIRSSSIIKPSRGNKRMFPTSVLSVEDLGKEVSRKTGRF